jgi:hypothetical protein
MEQMYHSTIQCNSRETGERSESSKRTTFGGQSETALTNARSARQQFTIGAQWD